jgi:hypothetical protein
MEWGFPPLRAGRAPQASRHSNWAEAMLGVVGGGAVRLTSVAVAARFGEGGLGPVGGRCWLEQAPTAHAKPTPPASRRS